jgi:hypothetical protein
MHIDCAAQGDEIASEIEQVFVRLCKLFGPWLPETLRTFTQRIGE